MYIVVSSSSVYSIAWYFLLIFRFCRSASKKRKSEHISESIENRPVKTMKRESEASRDTAAEESSLHLPETPTDMGASETPDARPGRGSSRIDMGEDESIRKWEQLWC